MNINKNNKIKLLNEFIASFSYSLAFSYGIDEVNQFSVSNNSNQRKPMRSNEINQFNESIARHQRKSMRINEMNPFNESMASQWKLMRIHNVKPLTINPSRYIRINE